MLDEAIKIKKEIKVLEDRKEKENESLNRILGAINSAKGELSDLEREIKLQQRIAKDAAETAEVYIEKRKEYENIIDKQFEVVKLKTKEVASLETEVDALKEEKNGLSLFVKETKDTAIAEVEAIKTEGTKNKEWIDHVISARQEELDRVVEKTKTEEARLESTIKARDNNIKILEQQADEIAKNKTLKEDLDKEVKGLNGKITDLNTSIETISHETIIVKGAKEVLESNIADLNKEIEDLEKEKAKSNEEYQKSTARIIALADREIALNQKEEYIKERYKEAGLRY